MTRVYFGLGGDRAIPQDYAGDGMAGIAVFRPSSGLWSVRGSERHYFGRAGDIPVPGDYDGRGRARAAVARGLGSSDDRGFVFAIFGDTHIATYESYLELNDLSGRVIDLIRSFRPDMTFHVGDAVDQGCDSASWDIFMELISPLDRAGDDFFLSIGNHDTPCLDEWMTRFDFPGNGEFYSIRHKGIPFIVLKVPYLNDCPGYGPGSDQYEWLAEELESASSDPECRFIIVLMHESLYGKSKGKPGQEGDGILTPLFHHYGVDAVFSGHHHNYQRSIPIRSEVNPEGTVYVITSGGGNILREPVPQWYTETAIEEHHAIRASYCGDRIEFEVVNADNQVIDSFRLETKD